MRVRGSKQPVPVVNHRDYNMPAVVRYGGAAGLFLGDGDLREALLTQARELNIAAHVDLPGFQANPWAWMSRASVFVLSSRWEGSPNTLTEAMALGIPVVSTDCPSGPRELLNAGRIAPLVDMGDAEALAQAFISVA